MPSTEHHMENISHLNAARLSFAKVLNAAESAVASQAGGAHAVKRATLPNGRERTSAEHGLDGTPTSVPTTYTVPLPDTDAPPQPPGSPLPYDVQMYAVCTARNLHILFALWLITD
ncbi:hypothetical protein BJV77DRAFT_665604 [Russula vinacea]|nr:hypothetical protein BJV77DRAFT_665604 [Russula vinacea]